MANGNSQRSKTERDHDRSLGSLPTILSCSQWKVRGQDSPTKGETSQRGTTIDLEESPWTTKWIASSGPRKSAM